MHCPECAAEVSALREFCPHCGTPLHRASRDGGQDPADGPRVRSDDELKRNRRNVLIIAVGVLAIAGISGRASWFGPAIHIGSGHRGPLTIDAEEIYDAYRDDAHGAERRFRGREMVVSGEFLRIVPDGQGNPDLRFKTSNPEGPLGADLVPVSYDEAAHLRPGQRVTVSCQRITRTGDEHWLQNCAIETTAPAAAPSPSAAPSPPSPPPSAADGNKG